MCRLVNDCLALFRFWLWSWIVCCFDSAAMMECLVVSEDGPIPRAVTVTVTVTLPLYFLE